MQIPKQTSTQGGRRIRLAERTDEDLGDQLRPPPLISVVSVVFNAAEFIEETITSVLNQTFDRFELIIIDGGSTDSTVDIIRKYEHRIDYWRSEKDGGIYDAMNIGISLACGKYINLLNASDWYQPDVLQRVAQIDQSNHVDDSAIIYTDYAYFHDDIKLLDNRICKAEPWRGMSISHQAMFVGSKVYKIVGTYNTFFRLSADFDFFVRAYKHGIQFVHLPFCGVVFRAGGRSHSNKRLSNKEAKHVLSRAYGKYSWHYIRFSSIEFFGFLYFSRFKQLLTVFLGEDRVAAIRQLRRRLFP